MTWRTEPPFRADHVGSLLRPPALLHARADHAAGTIDAAELRAVEDDAIREAVRMQEARRPAGGDRRRVAPRLLAHGLHLPAGRRPKLDSDLEVEFHNRGGNVVFTPSRRCAWTSP